MPPTTLLDFWTAQKAAATAARTAANAAAAAAQTDLTAQKAALAQALQTLATLTAQIVQIRAQLAAAATQADGAAALAQLTQALADTRAQQAKVLNLQAAVANAQRNFDGANAAAASASASLTDATAKAAAAQQDVNDRKAWTDAIAAPPLATLPADATAMLTADPYVAAKNRLSADLPAELEACARSREAAALSRQTADFAELSDAASLLASAIGDDVARLRAAYQTAEAALRAYATTAAQRLNTAQAQLTRVADKTQNPLTAAESAAIHGKKPDGTDDAALQASRADAAGKVKAVADAQADLNAKTAALESARLKALAKDVDADPTQDPDWIAKKADFDQAQKAVNDATNAVTGDMQATMAAWEAAVPDATWQMLFDFDDAERTLNALTAAPAALEAAVASAEGALVTALLAADKHARTLALLLSQNTTLQALTDFDRGFIPRQALSALRGD